ncbi:hypothetical protein ACJJIQ_10505 [Microbulbifer sp. ANSA003]|uniref:hypothetical protein n=1 Tax=Microbulbifer sp. ANSA003 TaxID=3243360 RepID=UPI004043713C
MISILFMRVVFLALRKGVTPLLTGLLVGCPVERTTRQGRENKVFQLYRAMDLCGLLRLAFAYYSLCKNSGYALLLCYPLVPLIPFVSTALYLCCRLLQQGWAPPLGLFHAGRQGLRQSSEVLQFSFWLIPILLNFFTRLAEAVLPWLPVRLLARRILQNRTQV